MLADGRGEEPDLVFPLVVDEDTGLKNLPISRQWCLLYAPQLPLLL